MSSYYDTVRNNKDWVKIASLTHYQVGMLAGAVGLGGTGVIENVRRILLADKMPGNVVAFVLGLALVGSVLNITTADEDGGYKGVDFYKYVSSEMDGNNIIMPIPHK